MLCDLKSSGDGGLISKLINSHVSEQQSARKISCVVDVVCAFKYPYFLTLSEVELERFCMGMRVKVDIGVGDLQTKKPLHPSPSPSFSRDATKGHHSSMVC
jgi:hypothetical protein